MKELPKPRVLQLADCQIEVIHMDCIHDPNNFRPQGLQLNAIQSWWRVLGTTKWLATKRPKPTDTLVDIINHLTYELQTYVDAYHSELNKNREKTQPQW